MRSFKIGDMVEYLNDIDAGAGSIGIVTGPAPYDGFPQITFVSGPDAGKTYAVNCGALRHKEEEKVAEKPVEKSAVPRKKWNKQEISQMIQRKEGAVERGVICLNKHADLLPEKTRGFVAFWAKWVSEGKTLSGKHLVNARRTCLFNAKVLMDSANGEI